MENQSKRDTTMWLNASPHVGKAIGPAKYETGSIGKKESFNIGGIAFGSHSKKQLFTGARVTHEKVELGIVGSPGPGQYGSGISPRDTVSKPFGLTPQAIPAHRR